MRRTFLFITVIVSVFFLCFFAHATTFTVESINSYIELDIITPLRDANYSETAMTETSAELYDVYAYAFGRAAINEAFALTELSNVGYNVVRASASVDTIVTFRPDFSGEGPAIYLGATGGVGEDWVSIFDHTLGIAIFSADYGEFTWVYEDWDPSHVYRLEMHALALTDCAYGFCLHSFGALAAAWADIPFRPLSVPEPSTMLLLGTGLIGLAGWGRRKLRRN